MNTTAAHGRNPGSLQTEVKIHVHTAHRVVLKPNLQSLIIAHVASGALRKVKMQVNQSTKLHKHSAYYYFVFSILCESATIS